MLYCTLFLSFVISFNSVNTLENGLARTPPMGWMSWGYYMCGNKCENEMDKCLNEKLILSVVDAIYTEGYQEAGYEYIIIDDCWSEKKRVNGKLVPDKKRFPRGMKFLADYIHARGLKFGMYTNIAKITCMQFPGSQDHFEIDAKTFAEWGVDYLKVDGCFVPEDYLNVAYISLGQSLNNTGRPMVYSCSWPYYIQYIHGNKPDYKKVSTYCNVWRNYHDVTMSWNAIVAIISFYKNNYEELSAHHGPGGWNDPDMLILGTNSLSHSQSRVHIAVYAMWSAPLLLSCDMAKLTPYEKELLLNLDLIAIAQDPLGIMAEPYDPYIRFDKPQILAKESRYRPRMIREAIEIKKHDNFNRDNGWELPTSWDPVIGLIKSRKPPHTKQQDTFSPHITVWVKPHHPIKGDKYPSYSFAFVNLNIFEGSVTFTPIQYGLNSTDSYTVYDVFTGKYIKNMTLDEDHAITVPGHDVVLYTLYPL